MWNSRFYTYGDLPLEKNLENIENKVLRHFDKISVTTDIPHEPRWLKPVSIDNEKFNLLQKEIVYKLISYCDCYVRGVLLVFCNGNGLLHISFYQFFWLLLIDDCSGLLLNHSIFQFSFLSVVFILFSIISK